MVSLRSLLLCESIWAVAGLYHLERYARGEIFGNRIHLEVTSRPEFFQMIDTRLTGSEASGMATLRRTLVRFSNRTLVFPPRLFLQDVCHLEDKPRSMSHFADVSYGTWSSQYVAVKRLRTPHASGSETSKTVSVHLSQGIVQT